MIHPEWRKVRNVPKVRSALAAYRAAYAAYMRGEGHSAIPYGSTLHDAERALNEAVENARMR